MHVGILAADLSHKHGWAHYSLSLIRAMRRAGLDLTVITTHDSPIPDDLHDVRVMRVLPSLDPLARGLIVRSLAALPTVRAALHDCDVIHTFVEPFAPLARAVRARRPYFVTAHGSYVRVDQAYPMYARPIMAQAMRRAAAVICVSHYTERIALQTMPFLKTCVIPNGVDIERFSNLPVLIKDERTILTVGAVKPRKGVIYLVRALAEVHKTIADARVIIVGSLDADRGYVAAIRAEINQLGLTDHVTLTGRISDEDLYAHYARADVFAFPSVNEGWKFEGFGLAVLEASAAGLPVIGSRNCGVEDAINEGATGFLTAQRDPSALADVILRVLSNADLRISMGAAGRVKASTMTWNAAAAAMIAGYRDGWSYRP